MFEGVSVVPAEVGIAGGTAFDFVGNYDGTITLDEESLFVARNQLYRSTGHSTLGNFRAYFSAKDAGVKNVSLNLDGIETRIDEVVDGTAVNGKLFDLSGRRIERALQKGVYVMDGKKVVK